MSVHQTKGAGVSQPIFGTVRENVWRIREDVLPHQARVMFPLSLIRRLRRIVGTAGSSCCPWPICSYSAELIAEYGLLFAYWSVLLAAVLEFFDLALVVRFLESGGGRLCHHVPSRSFGHGATQWAVCARCAGMYAGWIMMAPWFAWRAFVSSRRWRVLTVVLVITFVVALGEALAERVGALATSNESRFFLGLPLGMLGGFLLLWVAARLRGSR